MNSYDIPLTETRYGMVDWIERTTKTASKSDLDQHDSTIFQKDNVIQAVGTTTNKDYIVSDEEMIAIK